MKTRLLSNSSLILYFLFQILQNIINCVARYKVRQLLAVHECTKE